LRRRGLFFASTGTVVAAPWTRSATKTWRRINSTSGSSVAALAPTQSAKVAVRIIANRLAPARARAIG
jgi:hypothetical protein